MNETAIALLAMVRSAIRSMTELVKLLIDVFILDIKELSVSGLRHQHALTPSGL